MVWLALYLRHKGDERFCLPKNKCTSNWTKILHVTENSYPTLLPYINTNNDITILNLQNGTGYPYFYLTQLNVIECDGCSFPFLSVRWSFRVCCVSFLHIFNFNSNRSITIRRVRMVCMIHIWNFEIWNVATFEWAEAWYENDYLADFLLLSFIVGVITYSNGDLIKVPGFLTFQFLNIFQIFILRNVHVFYVFTRIPPVIVISVVYSDVRYPGLRRASSYKFLLIKTCICNSTVLRQTCNNI